MKRNKKLRADMSRMQSLIRECGLRRLPLARAFDRQMTSDEECPDGQFGCTRGHALASAGEKFTAACELSGQGEG